jgi:hypothetical protein
MAVEEEPAELRSHSGKRIRKISGCAPGASYQHRGKAWKARKSSQIYFVPSPGSQICQPQDRQPKDYGMAEESQDHDIVPKWHV